MLKVINATGDGACLFNAVAIGLGIEILSGRVDGHQNTQGYQRLLDEFAREHPGFNPQSWDNLKQWLAYYNHTRDIELVFAPVLFKLNQQYQSQLDSEILNEVTNLVWKNRASIQNKTDWFSLMNNELFTKIDNLEMGVKTHLLEALRELLQGTSGNLDRMEVKEFLTANAPKILGELKIQIGQDPKAFQRGYHCGELKEMADALSLNLVENNTADSKHSTISIRLRNVNQHWDIEVSDADHELVNKKPQQLNITSAEAFGGQCSVAAPIIAQSKEEITVGIKKEKINNPGVTPIKPIVNEHDLKKTAPGKPAESDGDKLIRLKNKVTKATMEYTEYSNKIWFSLFHHHGKAGRVRAEQFNKDFGLINEYKDAKSQLLAYLNDNSNGNTHPHSFRTMLLQQCQPEGKQKATLQETSKNFGTFLRELMKTLNNAVNTLIFK